MGWKAACILVNEREPGYLGTLPEHHSSAARNLANQLGLGSYRSEGLTDFDYGIFPNVGRAVIGAYDGAAIIASQDLVYGSVTGENTAMLQQVLEHFPGAEILVVELHSVVNYFAYAYYRKGALQRAYAGSAEDGVLVESGTIQLEEEDYFAHSMLRGTRLIFKFHEECTVDQIGENLAFSMASRFLGAPMDSFASDQLTVEEFSQPST